MEYEEIVVKVLQNFYHATGIEANFVDCEFNALPRPFGKQVYEDLLNLSNGKLETYLINLFEENSCETQQYYTCFFENNFVCTIVLYKRGNILYGAFVTQAIILESLGHSKETLKLAMCDPLRNNSSEKSGGLGNAMVVSRDRLLSSSEVLTALTCIASGEKETRQVLKGGEADPKIFELFQSRNQYNRRLKTIDRNHNDQYALFTKLMESISKGDKESLIAIINNLNGVSFPMAFYSSDNLSRSLKNSAIKISAMCACAAIGAGVPFSSVMNLVDDFIAETEKLDNMNDIFELIKASLFSFTRAVAVTRITAYSKPVRQVIEYIEIHYKERITLDKLAIHVGLSESYLSNLIKKETGVNLADHINRVRIEESKKIMLRTNVAVNELSSMVGYTYSNHFSKRFRKLTGMTPTEYQKIMADDEVNAECSTDVLRLIHGQIQHIASLFPGIFDIGRIVDPKTNNCWIQKEDGKVGVATCYDFWERNESCETCISHLAFEHNRPFVKMDQSTGDAYIILAAPITVGKKRYVLEILKNISSDFYNCIEKSDYIRKEVLK